MQLVVPLTYYCNYSCPFCYVAVEPPHQTHYNIDSLTRLVNTLHQQELLNVVLSGGEPTLISNLPDIIRKFQALGIQVSVLTNGSQPHVLQTLGANSYQISIDGKPKSHDKLRGVPGAFYRALTAIKVCKKMQIPVSIQSTISTLNFGEVRDLLDMLIHLPVTSLRINAIHTGQYALSPRDMFNMLNIIEEYSFSLLEAPQITTNLCRSQFFNDIWSCVQAKSIPWFADKSLENFYYSSPNIRAFHLRRDAFCDNQTRTTFEEKTVCRILSGSYSLSEIVRCLNDFSYLPDGREVNYAHNS